MWNQTQYYNIWLISEFDNNNGGGGTQGYAYFSGSHGQPEDGTVMLVNAYKDPVGITLAHELGHALNVYHTFEGDVNGTTCPGNGTCATLGDLVCDTPPHIRSASDCNVGGTNSCDGNSSNALFKNNYMDYSGDACQNMFTAGQNVRIQGALTTDRASFLAVNGNMSLVPPGPPVLDMMASTALLCGVGQSVRLWDWSTCIPNTYLADPGLPGITFAWTITNGTETHNSSIQNPTFTLNSTGIYNVTLSVTTGLGTFNRTEHGMVVVVAAPVAACSPTSTNAGNFAQTVNNVVFNTISNATDAINNVAYTNFACSENTIVAVGSTHQLAVTIRAGGSAAESLNGYIDYNNNGVFEDPSELVITGSTPTSTTTTLTANVTIPGGAVPNTLLRMRIYGEAGTLSAAERTCGAAFFIGDVEDYGVYITNNMASVTIAASPGSTISYGTNVTFTPTPVNGGASPVYTWYRNGVSVGTGPTYASNTFMPNETVHCSMASNLAGVIGSPDLSNTITMTVTGPPLTEFVGSPLRICAGSSVTFTDQSLLSPTSWSWTLPGGTPSTSSSQNPVITYAAAGTYNVTLVASNVNGTGSTMTKTGYITVYAAPTAGCVVTRSTAPTSGIGITNVTLNTINKTTVYDGAVMNDYTCSDNTVLSANTLYNISVTVGAFNNQWVRAYIDYNGDGDFVDGGEQIFAPANGLNVRSGSFTTPVAPTPNVLRRMRVISDFVNTTPGSCTTPVQYGQVEEYGVVFLGTVNTAPVLNTAASPALTAQNEDAGAPSGAVGTLVSALVDLNPPAGGLDNVTDADAGAITGIAITAADATNGTWFYSINNGGAWNALGVPSGVASRLLAADANSRLYFQPNANFNGAIATAITFRAWDQTSGTNGSTADASTNGGTTAFSTATDVASLSISAVNDAPVLSAVPSPALTAQNEDAAAPTGAVGTLVSALIDLNPPAGALDNATDVDAGAVTGMAITAADATNGTWFYSINNGGAWSALGVPSGAASRLLAADANSRLYFQPNANFNGGIATAITFRAWDQTSGTNGGTADASTNGGTTAFSTATDVASLTITAVNDAPTATNLSAAESYTEDVSLNLINIVVSDVDHATTTATLTLSNVSAGSLSTATSGAVTSTFSAGVWTASGAIANVNTLLAGVTFVPAANFNTNFNIITSVSDGVAAPVTGSKPMTGTAVNDAPTATNMSAAESYTEDVSLNLIDIVVSDVDHATTTATLTLSNVSAGSLSTATSGAVTSTFSAGVWTASGAIANVNILLAGVTFVPASNFSTSFSITTSVSDGVAAPVTGSKPMTGTAVNDAPQATNLSAAETYTEDVSLNLINIVVSDVDHNNLSVNLTLSDPSAGSLSTGTSGATTSSYVPLFGAWFVDGPIADVNALLASVTFIPAPNFNSNFTIITSVSDGVAAPVTGTKVMTGTLVNDAPQATNLGAAEAYMEDVNLNLVDIGVSDLDNVNVTATLTLSNPAAGSLTAGTLGALTSTYVAGTGVWSASGPIADVNLHLSAVSYIPALNFNANFTIATSVTDGVSAPLTGTKVMNGTPVNDPPVNTVPAPQATNQNTSLTLSAGNGNLVSIADPDAGVSNVEVTLTVTNGTLTLAAITGLTFSTGDGTADGTMVFEGTTAAINTALNGTIFSPTSGFSGSATLSITTIDLGNTGAGGELTDTDNVSITVNPTSVQVSVRAFLDGPYNPNTGLMGDGLRSGGHIPNTQPYSALGYTFLGNNGSGPTVAPAVLAVTGSNAIVDWVVIELRDNTTPTTVVANTPALVQCDGDVVANDGVSALTFTIAPGTYRVAMRHRNHLGVMTLNGVPIGASPTTVDFTSLATSTFGTNARKSVTGTFPTQSLWAGDVTFNGQVKYAGGGNDRDPILVKIGGLVPTATVNGYWPEDVNLNGQVRYAGGSNDRDPILVTIGGSIPTAVRLQQLP
ncbi:MAG: PKD domain-containing protein [Flavobacteriales bacterium]|nr:PKD domain-containing protein [Flavobacteriales bacterium]